MRTKKLAAAIALSLLGACSINPKPKPPTPPPPSPVCEEGQTTCCWHQPPGNEWLYACPAPELPGGVLNVAGGPAQCPEKRCDAPPPEPPVDPDPPNGPVPPKGTPQGAERLLRNFNNEHFVIGGSGLRFDPFMCIPCCDAWAVCPEIVGEPLGTGWPGFSQCFADQAGKYGCDLLHFRVGPWFSDDNGEGLWKDVGNAYNADGSWNPKFWNKLRELVWDAFQKDRYVEIVPIDDWWLKNACGKDADCGKRVPWLDADVRAWGKTPSPAAEALYKKTIEEVGCFGNTIFTTGNEEDLVPGTTVEHLNWRIAVMRDAFKALGCSFDHMIGTGSDKEGINADYSITHDKAPVTGPCRGRLCVNNEHNPEDSPQQEATNFKTARDAGQVWGAWRAGANDEKWEERLRLFSEIVGGGATVECFPPPDDPNLWIKIQQSGGDRADEVKAGQADLGSMCKEPKAHSNGDEAIAALNSHLRKKGYCAGTVGATDHVMILSENQNCGGGSCWEEHHAVAPYDTGCWAQSSNNYPLNRFRYTGSWTPPADACSNPDPLPISRWNVKEHTKGPSWTTIDSTPLVCDRAYCAAVGFTDGRSCCSVRQEGDPARVACESEVVGTPKWTAPEGWEPDPSGNPYMIRVPRGVSGEAKVCTSTTNVCGTVAVTP
jgi:hypothetical protein